MSRRAILLSSCIALAACAQAPVQEEARLAHGEVASAERALQAITVGKSTKDEVRVALGPATEIAFDSGYEVWVYREQARQKPAPRSELVLLFSTSGVLTKTRVRQGT